MAQLQSMPQIIVPPRNLLPFGLTWAQNGHRLKRSRPNSSMQLGELFDEIVSLRNIWVKLRDRRVNRKRS